MVRVRHRLARVIVAAAMAGGLLAGSSPARSGSTWDELRPAVFGERAIEDGRHVLTLSAPYRALDQRQVPVAIEARFADGRSVVSVAFVVDENPMPVVAVFRPAGKRERIGLGINIRLDQASWVRVIVEASDGRLYMAERFVKASGLGVCAAPPLSDQDVAAKRMGEMRLADLAASDQAAAATRLERRMRLDIRHPQNTGLQMNQVTMLYVPLRFISTIEVRQGDDKLFDMEGSMSLSENPRVEFDFRLTGAPRIRVLARDTSGAVWERDFPLGPGS